jgi:NAD(P)-dependent dehydrogenase (short-subunit alcohol dehydrogenase family)
MSDNTVPGPVSAPPGPANGPKSVLVTGSSSGIGLASVVAMSARGWEVFASMRDPSRSAALTNALGDRPGPVHVLQLDLTDKHSIQGAMAEVAGRTGGRLDALVHNAGTPGAGFFVDGGPDRLRETMETNLFGPAELTAAALPALSAARGRIVVVSSVAAFICLPGLSAYAASKWALEGWCSSLAVELVPLGIDIALVEPGTYKTSIWQHPVGETDDPRYQAWGADLQRRMVANADRMGRDPAEVGERIARVIASEHPHFRNPAGPDSWAMWAISKVVPAGWRNRGLALLTHAPAPTSAGN